MVRGFFVGGTACGGCPALVLGFVEPGVSGNGVAVTGLSGAAGAVAREGAVLVIGTFSARRARWRGVLGAAGACGSSRWGKLGMLGLTWPSESNCGISPPDHV